MDLMIYLQYKIKSNKERP